MAQRLAAMGRVQARLAITMVLALAGACDDGSGSGDSPDGVAGDVATDAVTDGAGDADAGPTFEPGGPRVPYDPPAPTGGDGDPDLTQWVDPFLGTGGPGHAIPGALVPHGAVRASPVTNADSGPVTAYEYGDDVLVGFSHTHLEGAGGSGNGYSHLLVMPTVGELETDRSAWASAFTHADEEASPGYYRVVVEDSGIEVELTATSHGAVHRLSYPDAEEARVMLDLGHSLGDSLDGELAFVGDTRVEGWAHYQMHPVVSVALDQGDEPPTGFVTVYFVLESSKPFTETGVWQGDDGEGAELGATEGTGKDLGAWGGFATPSGETVELRVTVSFVDLEGARRTMDAQLAGRTFDEVREAAKAEWNAKLRRLDVDATASVRGQLYTALYRQFFQPADYTEPDGRFATGAAGEMEVFDMGDASTQLGVLADVVEAGTPWRYLTDDWCMWDTFRTSHPLGTLVEPELRADVARSMLHLYLQGGWLPKCTWHATGYSRVMIGNHAIPILADALVKDVYAVPDGLTDAELALMWGAMVKAATTDNPNFGEEGLCGYFNLGTVPDYLELGYVPTECDPTQSVSMTLEYAYNDWTQARVAEHLGLDDQVPVYDERAGWWRAHWDDETGFMRARDRDGDWVEPFDPATMIDVNDFCEASSWIYSFFVPHDVPGLVEVMGGPDAFMERLDTFFADGHFDPSNQPSFHIPWLYAWAGSPERTHRRVREVLASAYGEGPNGLPGNDDAGSTSAWYALSALGLFPIAPGDGIYTLGAPLVDRATLHLHPGFYPGESFTVVATTTDGAPVAERPVIVSATLDGELLDRHWITHAEIVAGGALELVLGE